MTAVVVALAVFAGLAGSVQVAVMGRFGGRIGVVEALAFATGVQLVLALSILVVVRSGFGGIGGAFRAPPWMWLGGLMGLTVVFTITFAQPRIGATATIGILIAGQLVMGAVIDRFGLFGVDQIAISAARSRDRAARRRRGTVARPVSSRTRFKMVLRRRSAMAECEPRTRGGVDRRRAIDATEDAGSCRAACFGDTRSTLK